MEEQNKLFVFEKKEVVLIFLFIILIAIISFTLGVRIGKKLSLKADEYTQTDVKTIDLKSIDEEQVERIVDDKDVSGFEKSVEDAVEPETNENSNLGSMEERLKEEMEKLANENVKIAPAKEEANLNSLSENTVKPMNGSDEETSSNEFTGKYTIQLFSHQSQETAQEFADGFISKGYDVIINEVIIPGKGKWYRVSIGIFDNVNKAKDYLENEKSLFQNKNYIIQQI